MVTISVTQLLGQLSVLLWQVKPWDSCRVPLRNKKNKLGYKIKSCPLLELCQLIKGQFQSIMYDFMSKIF